jgi:tRNA_anti-like
MALTACKECGHEVSSGAKHCPHCGKRQGMSRWAKLGIGLGCLWLLGTVVGGQRDRPRAAMASTAAPELATPAPQASILTMTATELWNAYEANEVATDQQLSGHALQVTGEVDGIHKDFMGKTFVAFESPNPLMSVQAGLRTSEAGLAARVVKGQTLVVTCESAQRIVGTPMLSGCVFAQR